DVDDAGIGDDVADQPQRRDENHYQEEWKPGTDHVTIRVGGATDLAISSRHGQIRHSAGGNRLKSMAFPYQNKLKDALARLRQEGRYRVFADIVRRRGTYPSADHYTDADKRAITVWCSNDYLAMGQHPVVLAAMHEAIDTA